MSYSPINNAYLSIKTWGNLFELGVSRVRSAQQVRDFRSIEYSPFVKDYSQC